VSYILDTNVISELVRQKPNQKVVQWVEELDERQAYLSVITIGEISKGIERLTASQRRAALMDWLQAYLLPRFRDRILNIDIEVMFAWGRMNADLERKGKTMSAIDLMIAATALQTGFTIVTRNEKDFENAGVYTFNPWI